MQFSLKEIVVEVLLTNSELRCWSKMPQKYSIIIVIVVIIIIIIIVYFLLFIKIFYWLYFYWSQQSNPQLAHRPYIHLFNSGNNFIKYIFLFSKNLHCNLRLYSWYSSNKKTVSSNCFVFYLFLSHRKNWLLFVKSYFLVPISLLSVGIDLW